MWRHGVVSINSTLSKSSGTLLTHNDNFIPTLYKPLPSSPDIIATGVIDSGATYICFAADPPIVNIDLSAPTVKVGNATGQTQKSTGTGDLNLPQLPSGLPITGHIVPGFCHTLIGLAHYVMPTVQSPSLVRQ